MEKKDLQNGDWVELRRGTKSLVMLNSNVKGVMHDFSLLGENGGYDISSNYFSNLKNVTYRDFDIMKVWRNPYGVNGDTLSGDFINDKNLIWEREEIKEVTIQDIYDKFGCKVKIVGIIGKEKNIGYKIMESDMTCRDYQFEVGKTYEIEEGTELKMCQNGFHFCFDAVDCLEYYDNIDGDRRIFKVQYDEVIKHDKKGCTNKITILEEINILDYIRENKDKVDWNRVCGYQKLTESFIREFKDYVNWCYISTYQKLSESFILEFENRVDWFRIFKYQKLCDAFKYEYSIYLD